jgi:hypothetical protein
VLPESVYPMSKLLSLLQARNGKRQPAAARRE